MDDTMPEPLNADDKPIYDPLRQTGARGNLTYIAVWRIRNVAAVNLIAQGMTKLDTQNAMVAAQKSKLHILMWMAGAASR